MEDEEYTLIPEKEVAKLKKEVEDIKKNPIGKTKQGKELLESITELNDNIRTLAEIFEEAGKQFKNEAKAIEIEEKIEPVNQKVELLVEQNKKIANAIVSLADMIKEIQYEKETDVKRPFMPEPPKFGAPTPQEMPTPEMHRNFGIPQKQDNQGNMPPLPPPGHPKKGLKSIF